MPDEDGMLTISAPFRGIQNDKTTHSIEHYSNQTGRHSVPIPSIQGFRH